MVYDLSMGQEKRRKKEHDFSVTAFRVVQEATGQIESKPKPTFDAKALVSFDKLVNIAEPEAKNMISAILLQLQ